MKDVKLYDINDKRARGGKGVKLYKVNGVGGGSGVMIKKAVSSELVARAIRSRINHLGDLSLIGPRSKALKTFRQLQRMENTRKLPILTQINSGIRSSGVLFKGIGW